MKKKLLFIITQSEYGGAQRFLYNLTTRLDKSQYDIIVAFGNIGTDDFLEKELKNSDIQTHRFRNLQRSPNIFKSILSIFEIRNFIKKEKIGTIFLNSSSAGFLGSIATVFPSKINNLKIIYRIGGWAFNDPRPRWQKLLIRFLEKLSSKWKDIIIVNNKIDFDDAKKYSILPRIELKLIHNGFDSYKFNYKNKDEAQEKLSMLAGKEKDFLKNKEIVIGTIANFYNTKGLSYFLDATKEFQNRNIAFVIIGDGKLRNELEQKIKQNNLSESVFLVGQIPNAGEYIKAFDIFSFNSLKEGFPWAILEAMGGKVPVISTNVGAIPEIIRDGENGYIVSPGSAGQMSSKIKLLIEKEDLRTKFAIEGHQTVLLKFDINKMVNNIEDIL